MQLTVTGKQVEIGNVLREQIRESLESVLAKYFKTAVEAHVVMTREAYLIRAEVSLHIGRGIVVNASAAHNEASAAFEAAAERAAKQLRRCKRRLRDHHPKVPASAVAGENAGDHILAPPAYDDFEDEQAAAAAPTVIAEISATAPRLTVGEAAIRMDLADVPVLLFRNQSHGELNLVYRRADGNIGWVDPELDPARRQPRREPGRV